VTLIGSDFVAGACHQVATTNQEFFEAGVGNMTESWHADEDLLVIARFEVRHRAYLAPDGSIHRRLPAFASDTRLLVRLYRAMVLVRAFDLKAVALQRTGRLGTYAASLGQEAVSVGTASAMRNEDVLLRRCGTVRRSRRKLDSAILMVKAAKDRS